MTQASSVRVRVLCFAAVRELTGVQSLDLVVPAGTTVEELQRRLTAATPGLQRIPVAFAVNRAYARPDQRLGDGDEVALIPPISGGSGRSDLFRFELCQGQ